MPEQSKASRYALTASIIAIAAVTAAFGMKTLWREPDREAAVTRRVDIEPFHAKPGAPEALTRELGDSITSRVRRLPGLLVRARSDRRLATDLIVRGDVGILDGRLVIATRLYEREKMTPIWTGTLWRGNSLNALLVDDVTSPLAAAIYEHLARVAPPKLETPR
jgi:hypothetical protein